MSRLDYAPKLKEIEVTDIQKGLGVFTPKPEKSVSYAALKETLKKAGYTLDAADITVAGTLARDDKGWAIVVQASGQRFSLEGANVDQALTGAAAGAKIEITGDWKTIVSGTSTHEVISPSARKTSAARIRLSLQSQFPSLMKVSYAQAANSLVETDDSLPSSFAAKPAAPIRVTSPGLTVYKIEGSFQFPVVRNTGPLVLRTDRNILLGVKYLF